MTEFAAKQASTAQLSYGLRGTLYGSKSGWLMLQVPNQFGLGLFKAFHEPGVELPLNSDGRYNAHISVMTANEVEKLGGLDQIKERGQVFSYTTGPIRVVTPRSWPEMSKVWFIQCFSPELRKLRERYGLPPLIRGDRHFHVTFAVRKK